MIVNSVVAINALSVISLCLLLYIAYTRWQLKKNKEHYIDLVRKLQLDLREKTNKLMERETSRAQTCSLLHTEIALPLYKTMKTLQKLEHKIDEIEHAKVYTDIEFVNQEMLELKGKMEHFVDWSNNLKEDNPLLMQEISLHSFVNEVVEKEFLPEIQPNTITCINHIMPDLNVYSDSMALRASLLNVLKIMQQHENGVQEIHISLAICNDAFTIQVNNTIVGPRLTKVDTLHKIKSSVNYIISKKLLEDVGGALRLEEKNEEMLIFSLQLPKM
ncbi:MAG: hypothetical protein OIF50_00775 [Flavobacteriaceae bacterium]|nr:hypothetical protein [Flavobacteriaceae bacterium]